MKPRKNILLLIGLSAWLLSHVSYGQDLIPYYGLTLIPNSAATVIKLNDFPFAASDSSEDVSISSRVNRFIKQGENVLRIEFDDTKIQIPQEGEDEAASMFMSVEFKKRADMLPETEEELIFRFERQVDVSGKSPSDKKEILVIRTANGEREMRSTLFQQSECIIDVAGESMDYNQQGSNGISIVEIIFFIPDFPVTSLPWQEIPSSPASPDLATIEQKVIAINQAYQAKSAAGVVANIGDKLSRMAQSQEGTAADLGNYLKDSYEQLLFTIPEMDFPDIQPGTVEVAPYENLNLVRAVVGGHSPIQASGDEWNFSLDLYFSQVGGSWILVE